MSAQCSCAGECAMLACRCVHAQALISALDEAYLPPEKLSLVVAVQESNRPRELVWLAIVNRLAVEPEKKRVKEWNAGGPQRNQRVGPVARAPVLARRAIQ
eukprot:6213311-Pleurochrysis_carterae.AAC.15